MKLNMPKKVWNEIVAHLERAYPEEGCGLIIGVLKEEYLVRKVYPMENVWENVAERKFRYALSPKEWLKIEKEIERENLSILGIYHSHPNYPPYPSSFDLNTAWEGYVYLIIEIREGKFKEMAAFLINAMKEVREIPIDIKEEV